MLICIYHHRHCHEDSLHQILKQEKCTGKSDFTLDKKSNILVSMHLLRAGKKLQEKKTETIQTKMMSNGN